MGTLIFNISKILVRKQKVMIAANGASLRRVTSKVSKINAVKKNHFSSKSMKIIEIPKRLYKASTSFYPPKGSA